MPRRNRTSPGPSSRTPLIPLATPLNTIALDLLHINIRIELVVGGGLLVLLVLGHQVVHVALRLGELHLVHALAGVPMQEGLAPEHGRELLGDPLEQLLDGRGVPDERRGHL